MRRRTWLPSSRIVYTSMFPPSGPLLSTIDLPSGEKDGDRARPRVGDYKYHPFWNVLLDQFWVR